VTLIKFTIWLRRDKKKPDCVQAKLAFALYLNYKLTTCNNFKNKENSSRRVEEKGKTFFN
jgi:hypothetical protein